MIDHLRLVLGELSTNCYLVWDQKSKKTVIIDPADDGVGISEEIERRGLLPTAILATHGHFDHLLGGLDLKLIYTIPLYCHSGDLFLLKRQQESARHFLGKNIVTPNFKQIDIDLKNTSQIELGESMIEVIKTPGHTPGGTTFVVSEDKLMWTGDTIFKDAIGDVRHSYSDILKLKDSVARILSFDGDFQILPGHGETTTVGAEKR